MSVMTLDEAIETVTRLPYEQQEMLIEILHRRHIEKRRREIADYARRTKEDFHAGRLQAKSAQDAVAELRQSLAIEV